LSRSLRYPWSIALQAWILSLEGESKPEQAAVKLQVTVATIHRWAKGGLPKLANIVELERVSGGAVKASLAFKQAREGSP